MNRLRFLLSLLSLMAVSLPAFAQDRQYVFAWAYSGDDRTIYVSDRPIARSGDAPVDARIREDEDARKRWDRALERAGAEVWKLHARHVGVPGGVTYTDEGDADTARLRFVNGERGKGNRVVVVLW